MRHTRVCVSSVRLYVELYVFMHGRTGGGARAQEALVAGRGKVEVAWSGRRVVTSAPRTSRHSVPVSCLTR